LDSIQHLVNNNYGLLKCFIKNSETSVYQKSNLSLGFRYLERKIRNEGPLQVIDIHQHFPQIESLLVKPNMKGKSSYFLDEDLEKIKALQLDFILRFGFGIIKGDILKAPKYGIWSFHHGDPKKYRGGPPGFWEVLKGDSVNGVILQQLTEKLDGGLLLKEGSFKTISHSYSNNLYQLLEGSKIWPSQVVQSILLDSAQELRSRQIETSAPIYKPPSSLIVLKLLLLEFQNTIRFHYNALFKAEKWNIGTINTSIESLLENDITEINWWKEAPSHSYFADPFVDPENKEKVLVELYDYKKQKGKIAAISKDAKNTEVLELESHLSYPFTFKYNGKNYLLPENFEAQEVKLYEVSNGKTIHPTTLLKGKWVDPSLIYENGYWWLFCTEKEKANENLFLFYAETLDKTFTPHPLNPVLTDIKSARPAGKPFQKGDDWYRLGQNCSNTYGGSIQIKKIEKISITEYQESFVKEIHPLNTSKYNKGLHTLSPFGEQTLVDGKRFYFNLYNFKTQLQIKLKRLLKK